MMLLHLKIITEYRFTPVIDDVERAQRILSGLCPDCGKAIAEHTLLCPTEHENRIQRLKNAVAKRSLINTLNEVKDKKDV